MMTNDFTNDFDDYGYLISPTATMFYHISTDTNFLSFYICKVHVASQKNKGLNQVTNQLMQWELSMTSLV